MENTCSCYFTAIRVHAVALKADHKHCQYVTFCRMELWEPHRITSCQGWGRHRSLDLPDGNTSDASVNEPRSEPRTASKHPRCKVTRTGGKETDYRKIRLGTLGKTRMCVRTLLGCPSWVGSANKHIGYPITEVLGLYPGKALTVITGPFSVPPAERWQTYRLRYRLLTRSPPVCQLK